jgi:hypothetical protein
MAFRVPEASRVRTHPLLGSDASSGNNGAFLVESVEPGWRLALIASDGSDDPDLSARLGRWEHVSVHAFNGTGRMRTPNWKEMCQVKDLCWDGEDVVVQYHPRRSEYVNFHPHVLHLWRPLDAAVPTPPPIYVGPTQELAR